jgi:DNA-binding Xre family transcriptional regulator
MNNRKSSNGRLAIRWLLPQVCERRGLSVRALGELMKRCKRPISRAKLYRIFRLTDASFDVLASCCEALECKPEDLLELVGTPPAVRPPPPFTPPGNQR